MLKDKKKDNVGKCEICGAKLRRCPYCGSLYCPSDNDTCKRGDDEHVGNCREQFNVGN